MRKPSVRAVLHAAALDLKDRVGRAGHVRKSFGICGNLHVDKTMKNLGLVYEDEGADKWYGFMDKVDELRARVFSRWPQFSGEDGYPVPGGHEAFEACVVRGGNAWDKRTAYGRARRDLLDFLIAETAPKVKP